eukprot:10997577-Alexandrium_andersonii.AAC.1
MHTGIANETRNSHVSSDGEVEGTDLLRRRRHRLGRGGRRVHSVGQGAFRRRLVRHHRLGHRL